jgi:hypothetical protein
MSIGTSGAGMALAGATRIGGVVSSTTNGSAIKEPARRAIGPKPAQPDRHEHAGDEEQCAEPRRTLQRHADAHGEQADHQQRDGRFQATAQIAVELAARERKTKHHGQHRRAWSGSDRQRARQRGDGGQHGHAGFAQGAQHRAGRPCPARRSGHGSEDHSCGGDRGRSGRHFLTPAGFSDRPAARACRHG